MSNQSNFTGRIQDNWRQRAGESTTFRAELRVIPRWLKWALLAWYFLALAVVFWISISMPNLPMFGVRVEPLELKLLAVFGILTAGTIVLGAFVSLLGYIGGDAKRRGMIAWLWVLVALFVPYLIGVILYFVVREPLPMNCPQCGRTVNAHFNFCPSCQFNLRPNCPQCRRAIRTGDRFCPHCGFELQSDAPAPTGVQTV